ncbi:E3 ubiquitin-protein ligase TRIM45-like isoform X2 [Saccostrea echinata]|uniref:E3 ubiquitin-protein ligase TRIM45-like isoform X2 n=1 Tax=Saccostrea echinata TaxID=191078 RepID=UPI002A801941|nr:E3 ubiquitin-protein ligase TRIM45-like isoform X2 [Saccostrea echinata]
MNRFGGVYKDENVVCSTTCEIYIPASLPESSTSVLKCELHSFGHCDVYLIQTAGRSDTATGSISDLPGQQKIRMDLNLNNIVDDNLHYTRKDQYWYEFSRQYGPKERFVTVHFCKEDEHCEKFLELLQISIRTLEDCRQRHIQPENDYRLIAYETTGKIFVPKTSSLKETDFDLPFECVLETNREKHQKHWAEEHAVFTHIISPNWRPKRKTTMPSKERSHHHTFGKVLENIQTPDKSQRYLNCQKCSESFDLENKQPRLLPCLHTFCFRCIKNTKIGNKVRCTVCDITHDVMDMDKDCPRDDTRFDLIEYCKLKDGNQNLYCSVCPNKVATHRCTNCAEWLCSECEEAHKRVSATKKHILLSTEDMKLAKNLEGFKRNVMCKRHSENCLKFYCTTESCQEPMCATCALEMCEELDAHKTVKVESIVKEKREDIVALMDKVESIVHDVSATIERIHSEKKNIEDNAERVVENIDSKFESLMKIIEMMKEELKTELRKAVDTKLEVLEKQKLELVILKKQIEEAEELTDLVLISPNSVAVMQLEKTIRNKLQKLSNEVIDQNPRELSTFGFYEDDLAINMEQVIAKNAWIWTSSVFPDKCITIVDETFMENDSVIFTMMPQDYRGLPIKIDAIVMKATVEDPEGNIFDGEVTPREDEYAMVDVRVNVVSLGRHILKIYMGDKLVSTTVFDRTREE